MDRLATIKTSEARILLRLANALHETPTPLSRKRLLIEGLCELIDAAAGSCVVRHLDPASQKITIVSAIAYRYAPSGESVSIGEFSAVGGDWTEPPTLVAQANSLTSTMQIPGSAVSATLNLIFAPYRRSRATARERRLVDLFHSEMTWMYQPDVLLTSPSALSLSRRERQTLEHLLEGLSEKQIASKLSLSQNTVHHYVKSIHKHFDVSSRSELLARWVGK
ncbi:MAG TPA: helix-turn-helix transcriptional regulator [Tepidisphaeraceae bacterium]|jgi:DNA-binding CsgD family transcriptional regulator|nr:helix-turn-helix transcriptional regulator [Tepidisphaeraceae bacterium]